MLIYQFLMQRMAPKAIFEALRMQRLAMKSKTGEFNVKKEEQHAMIDIYNDLVMQGYTKEKIADKVHKDPSVVGKQITERHGNLTLQTAYEYAEVAGGRVVYVKDSDWERWHSMDQIISDYEIEVKRLKAEEEILNKQVTSLTETNESLTKQRESQQKIIIKLEANIETKEAKIDHKDEIIETKDKALHELLAEKGLIT